MHNSVIPLGEAVIRVALSSEDKDSIYAIMRVGEVDLAVVFVYEFPRPSPHVLNIGKTIETHLKMGTPVVVKALKKGFEKIETIEFLRRLRTKEIVAGDVYIEDHLRYMEDVARETGTRLIEPLWSEDLEELLYKEIGNNIKPLLIGTVNKLEKWLGIEIRRDNVVTFAKYCKSVGIDPLGERGEYHTSSHKPVTQR
jgi:diphthamide synthase (EF-2-diphthine--ammonia ligase)